MVTETSNSEQKDETERYRATWEYIAKWDKVYTGAAVLLAILAASELLWPGVIPGAKIICTGMIVGGTALALCVRPICPRCEKEFFKYGLARDGTWKNKCVHCGLPKGAPHDPDRLR